MLLYFINRIRHELVLLFLLYHHHHRQHRLVSVCSFLLFSLCLFQHPSCISSYSSSSSSSSDCSSSSKDCVCSYHFLLEDLKNMIQNTNPQELGHRILSYKCQTWRKLPDRLYTEEDDGTISEIIYQDSPPSSQYSNNYNNNPYQQKPKVHPHAPHFGVHNNGMGLRRKRRQVAESMNMYNAQSARNKLEHVVPKLNQDTSSGHHVYAYMGHHVSMFCSPDPASKSFFPQDQRIEWFHYSGLPITAAGVTANPVTGELSFFVVQLSDSDIYNCSAFSSSSSKALFSSSYQLSVVVDAINWLSITTYYLTRKCSAVEMEGIKRHLKTWISEYVCPICTVHDSSVVCDASNDRMDEYELTFALTAFNVENILQSKVNPQICTEPCIKAVHLLLLRIVQESMSKLLDLPIRVGGNNIKAKANSAYFEMMTGCLAGFQLMYKICFPCLSGHFSLRGESDCVECPHGFYQPSLGASSCFPCAEGYDTITRGAKHSHQCLSENVVAAYHAAQKNRAGAIVLLVIFGIILLILVVGLVLCCCFPNTKVGRILRKFLCFTWLPCCHCRCCASTSTSSATSIHSNKSNEAAMIMKTRRKSGSNNATESAQMGRTINSIKKKTSSTIIREKLERSLGSSRNNSGNNSKRNSGASVGPRKNSDRNAKSSIKYSQLENSGVISTTATNSTAEDEEDDENEEEEQENGEEDDKEEESENEDEEVEEEEEEETEEEVEKEEPKLRSPPVPPPLLPNYNLTRDNNNNSNSNNNKKLSKPINSPVKSLRRPTASLPNSTSYKKETPSNSNYHSYDRLRMAERRDSPSKPPPPPPPLKIQAPKIGRYIAKGQRRSSEMSTSHTWKPQTRHHNADHHHHKYEDERAAFAKASGNSNRVNVAKTVAKINAISAHRESLNQPTQLPINPRLHSHSRKPSLPKDGVHEHGHSRRKADDLHRQRQVSSSETSERSEEEEEEEEEKYRPKNRSFNYNWNNYCRHCVDATVKEEHNNAPRFHPPPPPALPKQTYFHHK